MCLCLEGVSPEELDDARVSWRMHDERSWGAVFSSFFLVQDEKRWRRDRQRGRILWNAWDAIAAELKTQIFLCCTCLNVSSQLPYIFLVWQFKFKE